MQNYFVKALHLVDINVKINNIGYSKEKRYEYGFNKSFKG
jgi:hypothetical protein